MLKRFFVYILLISFAARPAYFVGTVAYYETHINEIIEKYCVNTDKPELQCNGQCHLAKQLNATTDTSNSSDAVIEISTAFFPVFFQDVSTTEFVNIEDVYNTSKFSYQFTYRFLLCTEVLKPPIA